MRYEFYKNGISIDASLEKAIAHKIDKVEERLKRYHPDAADLEIRLTQLERQSEYECDIKLKAFKSTLNAKKSGPELRVAIDRSFEALMKELDTYRSKINKNLQS